MYRCPRSLTAAALLFCCAFFPGAGWSQEGADFEELWVTDRSAPPLEGLRIRAELPDRIPVSDPVTLVYTVVSEYSEKKARMVFRVTGADGGTAGRGTTLIDRARLRRRLPTGHRAALRTAGPRGSGTSPARQTGATIAPGQLVSAASAFRQRRAGSRFRPIAALDFR